MEQRKIIIVDSSSNRKVTVSTDATTFGELKAAARAAGINYEGKDWLEGLTKTSPVSDESLLPVNVPYKGVVTNNLVYMLTNTNKRIRSGMNRKEAYIEIKKMNLADAVKRKFGRNFTQVGTSNLVDFIARNKARVSVITIQSTPATVNEKSCDYKGKYEKTVSAIAKLLAFLPKEAIDDAAEVAKRSQKNADVDFLDMSVEELKKQFGDMY